MYSYKYLYCNKNKIIIKSVNSKENCRQQSFVLLLSVYLYILSNKMSAAKFIHLFCFSSCCFEIEYNID